MLSSSLRSCVARRLGRTTTAAIITPTVAVIEQQQRRHFWNPFAKAASAAVSADAAKANAASAGSQTTVTRVMSEASKTVDQHNEQLLGACLDLLEICDQPASTASAAAAVSGGMEPVERDAVVEVVHVLLHDFRASPSRQFDLVYSALCLPVASSNRAVQRSLMIVLESVVPLPLFRLFESQSLILPGESDESQTRRDALKTFAHALLGDLNAPRGIEDEEFLLVVLDDFKRAFPAIIATPQFMTLEADAEKLAMQAKLFVLLGRLCAEFDTDHDGKVLLSELSETAERVLGKEKAGQLLEGAVCDSEGRIPFNQLTALLTRPPPSRSSSVRNSTQK